MELRFMDNDPDHAAMSPRSEHYLRKYTQDGKFLGMDLVVTPNLSDGLILLYSKGRVEKDFAVKFDNPAS